MHIKYLGTYTFYFGDKIMMFKNDTHTQAFIWTFNTITMKRIFKKWDTRMVTLVGKKVNAHVS